MGSGVSELGEIWGGGAGDVHHVWSMWKLGSDKGSFRSTLIDLGGLGRYPVHSGGISRVSELGGRGEQWSPHGQWGGAWSG